MESLIGLILAYRYLIIFPLALVEGPILAFVGGSLVALGYFDAIPLFVVLVLGDVLPDLTYYVLGRYGGKTKLMRRLKHRSSIITERLGMLRHLWETHTFKTMMVTKFAYGLSIPLLVSAGLVHLPFRRFWQSSVPLSFLQHATLLALGYFFGSSLSPVKNVFLRLQIIVAAVVVMGAVFYLITARIRSRFLVADNDGTDMR